MASSLCSSSCSRDLFLVQILVVISMTVIASATADDLPIVYIFGDSTFDVGTNNYIETMARADIPYNGIDYAYSKPTGRFSNGYNTADQIVRLLGYQHSPPPFLALLQNQSSFQRNLLLGVNFASGGSGILDFTGRKSVGKVISMSQQVQQFATVQENITQLLGPNATAKFLAKSLFFISTGSNDIFENYDSNVTTPLTQASLMIAIHVDFSNQLKNLYDLGARKFGVISVPPVGCCPASRIMNLARNGTDGCLTGMNDCAASFHSVVSDVLKIMSSQQPGMVYSLGDAYNMTFTMMKDPLAFGFNDIENACCGKGKLNAEKPCTILESPNLCPDREDHLFWDMFHPTDSASKLAALTLYGGAPDFVAPMNFSQLARTCIGY